MPRISKKFAMLVVLAMLASMFMGMGTASAAVSYSALSTPALGDDPAVAQALGAIKVNVPAGTLEAGDSMIFKLDSGFDFFAAFNAAPQAVHTAGANEVVVPALIGPLATDVNGIAIGNVALAVLDANDEVQVTVNADQSVIQDFVFYIYLNSIEVESGTDKDCIVSIDSPPGSGFSTGSVLVGKASSAGELSLAVTGADTDDENFNFELRVKESAAGALKLEDQTLKIKLPGGYVWTHADGNPVLGSLWGDVAQFSFDYDEEELIIGLITADINNDGVINAVDLGAPAATDLASAWDIPTAWLAFMVDDEDSVKPGDIVAKISGKSDTNISEAVVGTYGDLGATVTAKTVPELISGQDEQEIGNLVVKESLGGSLADDRTVTFTLPSQAAWQDVYGAGGMDNFTRDEGLQLDFIGYTGSNDRTAKFRVNNPSGANAAEVELKNAEIAIEPGFEGDIVVEVGGNAGITGSVVVANVKSAITATATSTPEVIIGIGNQVLGDFTVTENVAGGFQDDQPIILDLPGGTVWHGTPTVTVTEGDLRIENVRRVNGDNQIQFEVLADSTTPSTISVTGAKIQIDRTVVEGPITMKVQGAAVAETSVYAPWVNSNTAAKCNIANVVTPAPDEAVVNGTFVIGSTSYTINGATLTMDVAPYIKDGRTFLPLAYVAQALGVTATNIIWDATNQTVTLMKGDKVVQVKIGSTTMYVNGAAVTLDVAPEISSSRTCLPVALLAQAFGGSASWDAATQTVTIK